MSRTTSPESDKLRIRMADVKRIVPNPYMSLYEYQYGDQQEEEKVKIRNVWNLRVTDEVITEKFEKLAKECEKRKKKLSEAAAVAFDINESSTKGKK